MAEFQEFLAALHSDPGDSAILAQIELLGPQIANDEGAKDALEKARKTLRKHGALEAVARLFDVEIKAVTDDSRRADLLLEKGQLLAEDMLEEKSAVECFNKVLEIRPGDEAAQETLANFDLFRENWKKFVDKYLQEAQVSTDRGLTTSMYLSAAKTHARYEPGATEVETYLRKALDADPRNREAAVHLERLLRREERWADLHELFEGRADVAAGKDERVHALLGIASLATLHLNRPELAVECVKKAIQIEPAHPRALLALADAYEKEENWQALVMLYTNALKAQRRNRSGAANDGGMLLQIAMLQWKRLDNADAAEEYFRRLRKLRPAHPAALGFYREYYPARGETAKLLQVLRQAQKAAASEGPDAARAIAVEMAELSENQLGNPEKAIDAWKALLRRDPDGAGADEARTALRRLYRKTEGWNKLLDLMKEDVDRLPAEDVSGRVAKLMEVVEIYRDRLKLDVMVINTYNTILKLDPHNRRALDDLTAKYKELGRWNDLIAVLGKKSEDTRLSAAARAGILREIADLWSERFGNYAQAIKPLEQLVALAPGDAEARNRLKDIYTRRRQWRALISLLGTEAAQQPVEDRRDPLANMARLASDRLGDFRLAIELWNRVLELPGGASDAEAIGAVAQLYEREKRYLPLAEIYRRQVQLAGDDTALAIKALERLGALLGERLDAPAEAARVFEQILTLDSSHGRATRTLRELHAAARDYDALEAMYGELGQWDELVDVLSAIADRLGDDAAALALLERAASTSSAHSKKKDKIARAWERVLAVNSMHLEAAEALVPIYRDTSKWARLLSSYEILLGHAESTEAKLELQRQIRELAEQQLGSRSLAFQWASTSFELNPDDPALLSELQRLGAEADAWEQVADILDRRAKADDIDDAHRLQLLRELGSITMSRLHQPEDARKYQQQVLELVPGDVDAISALEEIATQLSDWPDLLAVYRRRIAAEKDDDARLDLMFRIAFLEEERIADFDAAASTYGQILEQQPESRRALRALGKLQEARGDWAGLAQVLERKLAQTAVGDEQFDLHIRLGGLLENELERRADGLVQYKAALELSNHRREAHEALERYLGDGAPDEQSRAEVAELLLPIYEAAEDAEKMARAIEVLRAHCVATAADADAGAELRALELDRRLAELYQQLGEPERAYEARLRVLGQAPEDRENRAALLQLAAPLEKELELAGVLDEALTRSGSESSPVAPSDRRALAEELAVLYEEVLGDTEKAELAWLAVLDLEPTDSGAYDALDRIYRVAERWKDLRDLLLRRDEHTMSADERREILLSICDLDEGVLDDADGAAAAYRNVLAIDPSFVRAYKALERLLEEKEQWAELEQLIGDELDNISTTSNDDTSATADHVTEEQHIDLTYKRAFVRARHLADLDGAVDLLEEVIARHGSHSDARELLEELLPETALRLRIARTLEPLYEAEGLWRDLCLVLRAQHECEQGENDGSFESVALLSRVAVVEEEQMGHERAAFDTWGDAVRLAPAVEEPRKNLLRLGALIDRWADVADTYEAVINDLPDSDLTLRADMLAELAAVYDVHLADTAKAISSYQRLLEVDPGNPDTARPAAVALDRLYLEGQRWPGLVEILRRQVDWVETSEERWDLLARLAAISEEKLEDNDLAIAAWRELASESPEDERALDALERLFSAAASHRDLIEVLRRRVEGATEPDVRMQHLRRIAFLYEEQLEEPGEAINAHLEVLDAVPRDAATLSELARLYRSGERWMDLYETIERQLAATEDGTERIELSFQMGKLLTEQLERPSDALERFGLVLESDPSHSGALAAVKTALNDDDTRGRAAGILEPIYASGAEYEQLAELLTTVADSQDDLRDRLRTLTRVAELRERELGDNEGAFLVYSDAVRAAVSEPELQDLVKQLDRLAATLGIEDDLISIFEEIAPDVLDGDLQRRLYLDIADLARALRQDIAMARTYYQRVIDAAPDDSRALSALESIYREAGEHEKLYAVLSRKAELAAEQGSDYESQVVLLSEAAQLCSDELDRPDDAIMAWEQVLELAPDNKHAADALEALYQKSERWHDLVNIIERRLGFAFTVEEAVALRFRLGGIYETRLLDPDAAVDNYSAALGGDPGHAGATEALERSLDDPGSRSMAAEVLEPIYVSRQDWPKLVRIYEIKLEAAEEPSERLELTRYIARLYEDQLEELEGAFRWYGRVFREAPADAAIRDQLGRLATILESWQGLANVYQEYLDDEPGDTPEARDVALTLAELYDRRLDEVELGQAAYRRVLQSTPEDENTFARLEAMLLRAERWFALVDVYEDVANSIAGLPRSDGDAEQAEDEDLAARRAAERKHHQLRQQDLLLRMSRVYRDSLKDAARAADGYRAVLDVDPKHPAANEELDALYEKQGLWYELADLLVARIERTDGEGPANQLRMRLASIRESHLEDLQGAIDQYEEVLIEKGADLAVPQLERLVLQEDARERIADLLEPVYRENDWWQKLVVILDARLEFVDDPAKRVAMLREIAQIHETRGGDAGLALEALAKAWRAEPSSDDVLGELVSLAITLSAWDSLVETLEAGIADNYDYDLVARILARIADVHEAKRNDNTAAIAAWVRLLDVADGDPAALTALDRLYQAEKKFDELVKVLQQRADQADEDTLRVELLHRIAVVNEVQLDGIADAIGALKSVLMVDDSDATALDSLERLYRAEQEWNELAAILTTKIDLATEPSARRELRFAASEVADTKLNDAFEALSLLSLVLEEDPDDAAALAEISRLQEREKMWNELVETIDRQVALLSATGDTPACAELACRAAQVTEQELLDAEQALDRYAAVVELDSKQVGARAALDQMTKDEETLERAASVLERIYGLEGDHDAVAELYERRLAASGLDPEIRKQQYTRLVEIHEVSRGDLDAAFAVLARALAENPDDTRVQGELERMAAARGSWEELAALYEQRLTDTLDADLEYTYACKLANLYEEALGDLERAASRYQHALGVANDEIETLAALDRIYERAGKHEELAEILVREADATLDEAQQAEFLFRLGDLREQALSNSSDAVSAYRDVLERVPGHMAARGALERLLNREGQDQERSEIVGILEPLYENEGEWGQLADLLTAKLSVTADSFDRAQVYARIAGMAEGQLADPVRALDAAGGWIAEDPRSEEALGELTRLAEMCNRWDEMAARLSGIIESADSVDDVKRSLMLELGKVQLEKQGNAAGAEITYRAVLDDEPESVPALLALEQIYRSSADAAALADVLRRRGEVVYDGAERRQIYAEVATLREQLGDAEGAVAAWREVLDLEEGDREAHGRLAALYQGASAWPELIELLGVAARYAPEPAEEAAIRTRIAQIYSETLADFDEAVGAWQSVLDVDPESQMALEALLAVHREREDWLSVQEVLTRKLDMAPDDGTRIGIFAELARVASEHRDSADDSIGYLYQILDIDNSHFDTYKQLEKILSGAERWHDLVELLEREGEVYGTLGHGREEVACLARAADVLEGPLENAAAAGELLEKILRREPSYVPALTRLSKIYEGAGDWDRCSEVLQRAAQLGAEGADAAELYHRLGEVERQRSGELGRAREYWTQALHYDPHHGPSVAAFEELAREEQDWALLADMVGRREAVTEDPDAKLELTLELAELYGERLGQPQQVIPLLERAVGIRPDEPRVLAPLADLYFVAGDHAKAAPIYERLADEAKKKRKMKDVAKYRQRLAGILEAQGDTDGALAAYEEAFRVNPTNTETMAGLGRIYMARQTWDKARRVYRSMVLQNLDPKIGVTKAEVYYNLGVIHQNMDEPNKAKGMFQRGIELEPDNAKLRAALDAL